MKNENLSFLPGRLVECIDKINSKIGFLEEIRIRKNRNAYIIVNGENISLNVIVNELEMEQMIKDITKSSLYAFRDTIVNGYIPYENGIRIGIIGTASLENGQIMGIYNISELAIRLPNLIDVDVEWLSNQIENHSSLIYSPPGEGKTTLLRALIKKLSSGRQALRVVVVDSRNELSFNSCDKSSFSCFLQGYPRKIGIEIAIRTMNAQMLVCDEIGDISDARAIIEAQGAGVPIIATCHGSNLGDILSHIGILELHKHRIFDYYIAIKRGKSQNYAYTINNWREANDYL